MSTVTLSINETNTVVDRLVNFFVEHEDLRTKNWFLSNAPGPLFTILAVYLYFCLYAGPRWMRDRKPFELKNTLLVYNAIQVVLSWVLFYEVSIWTANTQERPLLLTAHCFCHIPLQGYKGGWGGHYNFKCQPVLYATDPISMRVSYGGYWFTNLSNW